MFEEKRVGRDPCSPISLDMVRDVRESGSCIQFFNPQPFKEKLSPKASFTSPTSLEPFLSVRSSRFDGKPPSGKDSRFGQSRIDKLLRDQSSICMFRGNDSNLGHSVMVRSSI